MLSVSTWPHQVLNVQANQVVGTRFSGHPASVRPEMSTEVSHTKLSTLESDTCKCSHKYLKSTVFMCGK